MYKGTTPTIILTFDEGVNFTDAKSVVVTFATDYRKVLTEKTGEELEIADNVIRVPLTQKETLAMPTGNILIQTNILYLDGSRLASDIVSLHWTPNLKGEIML